MEPRPFSANPCVYRKDSTNERQQYAIGLPGAPGEQDGCHAHCPLLAGMAVPMMISMLVQALYNIVDSVFVAQISQDALNAVSLAFPSRT